MNLFQKTLARKNLDLCPPVWMMRQAGRYHSHYQNIKAKSSFMEMCKSPDLACEVTMGPIEDFDFDAAILFSDLLFPLEVMGMGLEYSPGPKLGWHLRNEQDANKLLGGAENAEKLVQNLSYQGEALRKIRARLSPQKGLIGFVGGPVTLFSYAVEGSHQGGLVETKKAIKQGLFEKYCDKSVELVAQNMALQARNGAEAVAIFDTCAGEFDLQTYRDRVVPQLKQQITRFKEMCPSTPVIYYSKKTTSEYWETLRDLSIDCLGVDWNVNLVETLDRFGDRYAIQGNIDPEWLHLPNEELVSRITKVFESVKSVAQNKRQGWVCGLGHGVLQHTPEQNVRSFVQTVRKVFR